MLRSQARTHAKFTRGREILGSGFGLPSRAGAPRTAPGPHLGDEAGELEVPGEGDVEHGAVGVLAAVLQRRLHGHPPPGALDDEDGGVEGEAEGGAGGCSPAQSPPAVLPKGGGSRESHGTRARTLPLRPCPCPRGFRNHGFLVRTREESYFPSDFLNNGVQLSGTQLSTLKAAEE